MSAFGTKKSGSDETIQMGFPAVFSEVAAKRHLPQKYESSPLPAAPRMPIGTSLQDSYHEQKRIDANRRALNGVRDTAAAKMRFLKSHAGYVGLPKVVLGQRRFANPSNGNQADIYPSRRDMTSGGLRGGVLRTAEAQRWGREKLKQRSEQLDAIDTAASEIGATGEMPTAATAEVGEAPIESTKAKLELIGFLQSLRDAFLTGDRNISSMVINDYYKALKLLFRLAPTETREGLEDLLDFFNTLSSEMADSINARAGNERDAISELQRSIWLTRAYLKEMLANVDKSPKERKDISRNLVKTYGFTRTNISTTPAEAEKIISTDFEEMVKAQEPAAWMGRLPIPAEEEEEEDVVAAAPPRPVEFNERVRAQLKEEFPTAATQRTELTRLRDAGVALEQPLYKLTTEDARLRAIAKVRAQNQPAPAGAAPGGAAARGQQRDIRAMIGQQQLRAQGRYRGGVAAKKKVGPFPMGIPEYVARLGVAPSPLPVVRKLQKQQASVKFDPVPRNNFGARQGAYFGEQLPLPEGYVPERSTRKRGAVQMPIREAPQIAPAFPDVSRSNLPTTREGFVELATKLRGKGHNIRVNSGSQLKNIRQNFIKKLKL
jgi:hypothetical protein